jgi:hypothetical protein
MRQSKKGGQFLRIARNAKEISWVHYTLKIVEGKFRKNERAQ